MNNLVNQRADKLIESLFGQETKPVLTEGMTETDWANMIIGACGGGPSFDVNKLRKGLKTLKKGALKKLYAGITGEASGAKDVVADDSEDAKDGDADGDVFDKAGKGIDPDPTMDDEALKDADQSDIDHRNADGLKDTTRPWKGRRGSKSGLDAK